MFLGSKIFILEILISLGVGPFSQAQVKAPPPPKKQIKVATKTAVKNVAAPVAKPQLVVAPVASVVTAEIKKPAPRTASAYELGVSYYMWNEKLKVSNGTVTTEGFANYAGFGINLEKNWTTNRWFRGGSLSYALGKVSSGGFDSAPTFVDGINRSWQATQATIFSMYRFDTTFMAGLGILGRQRDADWLPKNSTITTEPAASTQIAGQILMRWQIARRIAFLQNYTLLNLDGSTMWTWTAQFSL